MRDEGSLIRLPSSFLLIILSSSGRPSPYNTSVTLSTHITLLDTTLILTIIASWHHEVSVPRRSGSRVSPTFPLCSCAPQLQRLECSWL